MNKKIEAIDLFCGAGGLTAGLMRAGLSVKAGYDIEDECLYPYEYNNVGTKFIKKDVNEIKGEELQSHYSEGAIRLLAGCAPCQPFSTYNQGKNAGDDKKWPLLYSFSRLIRETRPELVTMENVPDVVKHSVYHDFINTLKKEGYNIWSNQVLCADYGVPQMRRRHVLLASRIGQVELINPTHKNSHRTVREAISSLPNIEAGMCDSIDILHRCSKLTGLNIQRIQASKPGGTWLDWPEYLRLDCHRKKSGSKYNGVYGRMSWDKPAPTITTQCFGYGNGRFGHPEQDRGISLREAAIFQSFPEDYRFIKPTGRSYKIKEVGKMIGNAVPVRLGEVIGLSFRESVYRANNN